MWRNLRRAFFCIGVIEGVGKIDCVSEAVPILTQPPETG